MPIALFTNKQHMSNTLKEMTRISLANQHAPRILFPTGTTPLGDDGFFQALLTAKHTEHLDTSRIRLVSGDEYANVAAEHPGSFAAYLHTKVLAPLDIDPSTAHFLNGTATNATTHCREFEASLATDPCSLAVLGLGTNGHVAFNDPPSSIDTVTRRLPLTQGSILASQNDFPNQALPTLPTHALSVGLSTLTSHCRVCCVLVTGTRKAEIVRQVLEEDYVGENVPASQLRCCPNFMFCLDEEAAALLSTAARSTAIACQHVLPAEAAGLLFAATSTAVVNGDVGGTNARMQLWDVLGSGATMLRKDVRYSSAEFSTGEELIRRFLNEPGTLHHATESIDALALAICGPVVDERVQAGVVLPEQGATGWGVDVSQWVWSGSGGVDRSEGGKKDGSSGNHSPAGRILRARLLNDFVAVGLGVTELPSSDIHTLHACSLGGDVRGTKACVGAGTGLGAVFMTRDATHGHYTAHPSEGGMGEFSAQTEQQWRLRQYIKKELGGYCTVESVVSGPGLVNCYHFINSSNNGSSR